MALTLAEQGRGGGLLGAWMLSLLLETLGLAGTVVVLLAWLLSGVMLVAGWSIADVVEYGIGRAGRAARPVVGFRPAGGRLCPLAGRQAGPPGGPGARGAGTAPARRARPKAAVGGRARTPGARLAPAGRG